MSYKYLEQTAIADIAFEAEGRTLAELFESAAAAVTNVMVRDMENIEQNVIRRFCIEAPDAEMLLYYFLQELIFLKDSEILLFRRYRLNIERKVPAWHLYAQVCGEEIDSKKHELLADVKAVAFHNFSILRKHDGWAANVIVDV